MSSGGKRPGATRSRTFLQAGQSLFEEALAPLADDFPASIQTVSDLIVGQTLGRMEDHLGAEHLKIWQRILGGSALEFLPFLSCELDLVWAFSRHMTRVPQWVKLARKIR